jgi:hypothetical protein
MGMELGILARRHATLLKAGLGLLEARRLVKSQGGWLF